MSRYRQNLRLTQALMCVTCTCIREVPSSNPGWKLGNALLSFNFT